MKSLRVFVFACAALLCSASPIQIYAGQSAEPKECRVEMMDEVKHKTFYDYCSSFEGSEINTPRHSVYFAKNEEYADAAKAVLQILNPNGTTISPRCLTLLQPFVCFYFFKFPLSNNCADGYLPPCTDLCERTHEACMDDFESMVKNGVIEDPSDLDHLECTNFKENSKCITFTPPVVTEPPATTETSETDVSVTEVTDAPATEAPVECNCAKKVRQSVTRRMILDPAYTLAAQISVLAMREEGKGAERHVVYDVTVLKEYQISCRARIADGEVTTIHMETPMQCLEGDYGCRAMKVGRGHEYLVVGTTTSDGKWLLRDSKGSGGCAISDWSVKYEEKMHKWASKSVPTDCTTKKWLPVTE